MGTVLETEHSSPKTKKILQNQLNKLESYTAFGKHFASVFPSPERQMMEVTWHRWVAKQQHQGVLPHS